MPVIVIASSNCSDVRVDGNVAAACSQSDVASFGIRVQDYAGNVADRDTASRGNIILESNGSEIAQGYVRTAGFGFERSRCSVSLILVGISRKAQAANRQGAEGQ